MHSFLKQSTASQSRAIGPFLDDTDFTTAETGLTIANTDIKLIVNGGASADKNSGGGTHRANGVYGVTFDATDTATVGEMFVSVKVAGALPVFATFVVLEEAVYDALLASSAPGYLQPTTAGRTLDVSSGGEAGIDWANVGSPTTTVGLTNTTLKLTATGVDEIWDEALSGHTTAGTAGKALSDAAAAGTPPTAAAIADAVLEELVADHSGVGGSLAAVVAAIDPPTDVEVADAVLGRNIAGGSNGGRTVKSALRALRNKVAISAGTMTVYEEDDTTSSWTAAVTTAAGNPVTAVDPA
jgi:hypothetical protein